MALVYKDRVKETSTTTGTTDFALSGAVTGFQAFSTVGNTNTCYYTAVNGTEWEVGIGTYSTTGPTLARTTILDSSNSGAKVSFSAGTKTIFLDYPAGKAFGLDQTLGVANGGTGQTSYTNGQLLIGNTTGNTLAKATLTAGTGITITNGAGAITVANTIVGASIIDTQTFNSSGTWTKPGSGTMAIVRCWGGGGSGGAVVGTGNRENGGGGGGAFTEAYFMLSDLTSTVTVTVGLGGAAITSGTSNGNVGGTTTFGSYVSAYGGGGGATASSDTITGAGGSGGGSDAVGISGSGINSFAGGSGANTTVTIATLYYGTNETAAPPSTLATGLAGATQVSTKLGGSGGTGGSGSDPGIPQSPTAGGTATLGGGGGAGGVDANTGLAGGNSTWGGGGGGGGMKGATLSGNTGGTSTYGGAGGAGAYQLTAGAAGTQPGGGGGGGAQGLASGKGGDGKVVVYVI